MPSLASLAIGFATGVVLAVEIGAQQPGLAFVLWLSAMLWVTCRFGLRGRTLLCIAALCGGLRVTVADQLQERVCLPAGAQADDRAIDELVGVVSGPVLRTHAVDRARIRLTLDLDRPARARVEVRADADVNALPGDRVRVRGRLFRPRGYRVPGAADRRLAARARGIDYTVSATALTIVERDVQWTPWRAAARAHQRVLETISTRAGDPAGKALLRALTAGDHSGLDRDAKSRYRDAGVAHILAVSGLHLAVIAVFTFALVRRLWAAVSGLAGRVRPALVGALCAGPLALLYTLLTGARISTLRALLVVAIVLLGAARARRTRVLDALGGAALALLLYRPHCLYDLGFQLSFAATATLILVAGARSATIDRPVVRKRRARLLRALSRSLRHSLRQSLATSLFATLATAPLLAAAFGQVALGSFVGNLVAVPITELCLLPIGLAGAALNQLSPALGGPLLDVAIAAAALLDRGVAVLAQAVPPTPVFPPGPWELGAYACALGAAIWCARNGGLRAPRIGKLALATAFAATLAIHLLGAYAEPHWRSALTITFLDVGQGDAAVVELPGGAVWMIDGGGQPFVAQRAGREIGEAERRWRASRPGRLSVRRFLAARRIQRIDRLIISHPHPDHYEGLFALLGDIEIVELWTARPAQMTDSSARVSPPESYTALLRALEASGTRIHHPRLDRDHVHGPVTIRALAPRYLDDIASDDPVAGANDNSLVITVAAYGRTVLFAGDLEREGEELLLARYPQLEADIVKVPHHGSRTSSTVPFTAAVRPRYAIVSCGLANRFGFPAQEIVARWRAVDADVLRTDAVGAVSATIDTDGTMRVDAMD